MEAVEHDRPSHDESFDSGLFRHVVGHLTSGVSVVTTEYEGTRYGMTASSVTSLSLDPPMMLACVNRAVPTAAAISGAGHFAINVLGNRSEELARGFARPSDDKFHGVAVEKGRTGAPLLSEALARIECVVSDEVVGGSHVIFLGRVVDATASMVGEPLAYFRGAFGRFEFASHDDVYLRARRLVLDRQYAADSVLDPADLAVDLDADEGEVLYALTRLSTDRLIRRDPGRGYVIIPFDQRMCDEVFDARCAIELGAIEVAVGSMTESSVRELSGYVDEMQACISGDRFTDFERYLDVNQKFHLGIVNLSGNAALASFFKVLSVRTVMARSFGSTEETSQEFINVQRQLIDALAARDLEGARMSTIKYAHMAKKRASDLVAQRGGSL